MKVLHTIPGLNISSGGPSFCTYNLLKGLRKQNLEVDILTLFPNNSFDQIIGNDDFIKLAPNNTYTSFAYNRSFKFFLKQNTQYDLYHANTIWCYPTHATLHHAQKRNIPCIITPHGMLYPQALKISAWKKKIALPLFQLKDLKMTTCLHATCMPELQYFRAAGLTNPVAIVQNCLNIDKSETPHETLNSKKRFGFVGRLHRIKNLDGLLYAWSKLNKLTENAELIVIGGGNDTVYEEEIRRVISLFNIRNISFTGFLTGESLAGVIRSLDFLVLPSHSENFGMVVPEALVKGIPVIASKGTPWEELNTHRCGWWVENDVDKLAATIEAAINTPENLRREMGENGRKLVIENYSMEVVAKKMIRLYKWILEGGEKPEFVYI